MFMYPHGQKRPIDTQVQENYLFWTKSYTFIKKIKVKTWHGIFLLAFFTGIMAALIWSVSLDWHDSAMASASEPPYPPTRGCIAVPAGGFFFDPTTPVEIKCGKYVGRAEYKWNNEPYTEVINVPHNWIKIYNTEYVRGINDVLYIKSYSTFFFWVIENVVKYDFNKNSYGAASVPSLCDDTDGGMNYNERGLTGRTTVPPYVDTLNYEIPKNAHNPEIIL